METLTYKILLLYELRFSCISICEQRVSSGIYCCYQNKKQQHHHHHHQHQHQQQQKQLLQKQHFYQRKNRRHHQHYNQLVQQQKYHQIIPLLVKELKTIVRVHIYDK